MRNSLCQNVWLKIIRIFVIVLILVEKKVYVVNVCIIIVEMVNCQHVIFRMILNVHMIVLLRILLKFIKREEKAGNIGSLEIYLISFSYFLFNFDNNCTIIIIYSII